MKRASWRNIERVSRGCGTNATVVGVCRGRNERTVPISSQAPFFSTTAAVAQRPQYDKTKKLVFIQSPNPEWMLGYGPNLEFKEAHMKEEEAESLVRRRWNMDETSTEERNKLLTSAIAPRPLSLVSTLSNTGKANLTLFSYFSMVSHNPAMLSISLDLRQGRLSARENILSSRQFTVNIVDETFIEAANSTAVTETGASYIDEWALSGLSKEPSRLVRPHLVRESPISMECELYSFHDICAPNSSEATATLILGLVKYMHIRADVFDDSEDQIDAAKLRAVGKLGGHSYTRILEAFDLPPPSREAREDRRYNGLLG